MTISMKPRPENIMPLLEQARDSLLAAQAAIPTAQEVEQLKQELQAALERGYFTPNEDAEIKKMFAVYLHVRAALHQTLQSLRPLVPRFKPDLNPLDLQIFIAGWLAGCMLMRTARYTVTEFYEWGPVRKLLNQADPVLGIPQGVFDQIHRGSTRPETLIRYLRAAQYAESRQSAFMDFREDPLTGPLLRCLKEEEPYIEKQKRKHAQAYAKCQWYRIRSKPSKQYRAVMWGLFEASGRAIAEMRNPFHRKRVGKRVLQTVADTMQPGDVLITRHDDAMSNLFLPGFWPHAAFIIGTSAQRAGLGVQMDEKQSARCQDPVCILESKKDGVRFRSLADTLSVDAFMLLRPNTKEKDQNRIAVENALTHEGKLYDFEFDFSRSDKVVCTELVYRALDGLEGIHFDLIRKAGRFTLPAEELLRQGLQKASLKVLLCYGLKGNQLHTGNRAEDFIQRSLKS